MHRPSVLTGPLVALLLLGVVVAPVPAGTPDGQVVVSSRSGRLSERLVPHHPEWRSAVRSLSVESQRDQPAHECPYEEDATDSEEQPEQESESTSAFGLFLIGSSRVVVYPPAICRMLGLPGQCGQRPLVELRSTCLRC